MKDCPFKVNGCTFQAETEEAVDEHVDYMIGVEDDEHEVKRPEARCEALNNPGVWPFASRCPLPATVQTPDGSNYCKRHEGYDN